MIHSASDMPSSPARGVETIMSVGDRDRAVGELIDNAMNATCRIATLEVVAMGRKLGLSLASLTEAINQSTGRSRISQSVLPAIVHCNAATSPALRPVLAGLDQYLALGMESGVPTPLGALARGLLQVGANTRGSDARLDDVIDMVESMAGARLADERAAPPVQALPGGACAQGLVVGYVGLGAMGTALARRMLRTRGLHVFDARSEAVDALAAAGAIAHKDLPSLAGVCDVVMVCLPTSEVVREVLFGAGGLLKGLAPGAIVVDQTSGDPTATREMAEVLRERGIALVDAPVSGGPGGAAAGTIATFCGGPQQAFETVRSLLETAGPGVTYFGASGNGHAAKLIKNALGACNRLIAYEALALGVKLGLRIDDIACVINRGAGWSATFERIAAVLATGGTTATLRIELMVKDLDLASKMGMNCGAPMLMANAVRNMVQAAANELGGDANIDRMASLYQKSAGVCFTGA
jgi:3-hydroxyisobutyrate dehydrogenase